MVWLDGQGLGERPVKLVAMSSRETSMGRSQNRQNMKEKLNNQGSQITYSVAVGQPLL